MLAFRLLGPLTITLNEKPVTNFVSRKAEALLAYLAFTRAAHPRERLADLLWGESTTSQAQSNLRVVLSNLRKLLGNHLLVTRHTVSLNLDLPFTVDIVTLYDIGTPIIERLERDMKDTSHGQARATAATDIATLQETLALYKDQLLTGLFLTEAEGFENWLMHERGRVEAFVTRAYDALLAAQLSRRAYPAVIANANHLLSIVPWHERAYQTLMMAHARIGDLTTALAVYQRCQYTLQEELAAPPSAPTTRLYLRIRAARTTPARPLPLPPTPLVGRESEVNDLTDLLQSSTARLVTLLGMGGVGKTRIALAVAETLSAPGRFLHGVHFVRLEAVLPAQLPATLAAALGITLQSNHPAVQALETALQDKEMLIVLDNLETLLNTGRGDEVRMWVAAWIAAAPDVKWLVTSQTQMRLREELLVDIEGLHYPGPKANAPPAPPSLQAYPAIMLFLQSAHRHLRKYTPAGEWNAIVRLTQVVEGLPLALEMAGAAMREHSCTALVAALERNLDALRSPHTNVPPRHLGIRAIFAHAWDSLSPAAQTVLSQLAYLRGPFSTTAATAIAGATAQSLNELTAKSMVRFDTESNTTYSLHSLTRAFAFDHLAADPDALHATAERHSRYYTTLLADHHSTLMMQWMEAHLTLMEEFDSLHTGLTWCIEHHYWEELATCIEATYLFFMYSARFTEGEGLLALADRHLQNEPSPEWQPLHQRVRVRRVGLMIEIGHTDEAEALLAPTFQALEIEGDRGLLAAALIHKSRMACDRGNYDQAQAYAERVLTIREPQQDPYSTSYAYRLLAIATERRGDYERSEGYSRKALALVVPYGSHTPNLLAIRVTLANTLLAAGKWEEAEQIYREGLALAEQLEITTAVAILQTNLGILLWKQGNLPVARTILLESLALKQVLGNPVSLAISHINIGEVYTALTHFEQARHSFHQALILMRDARTVPLLLDTVMGLAALWWAEGERERASEWLRVVAFHPQTTAESRARAESFGVSKVRGTLSITDPDAITDGLLAQLHTRELNAFS